MHWLNCMPFDYLGICGKGNHSAWRGRNNGHDGSCRSRCCSCGSNFHQEVACKWTESRVPHHSMPSSLDPTGITKWNIFYSSLYISLWYWAWLLTLLQVKNNRSSEEYVFNHSEIARRALKNLSLGIPYVLYKHTFTSLVVAVSSLTFVCFDSLSCMPWGSRDYWPCAAWV